MHMQQTEKTSRRMAKSLAPEDVRPGMFVALLHDVDEFLPFVYLTEAPGMREVELLRVSSLPEYVQPMKVIEVCLPYVLVRCTNRRHRAIDVRRCRLARVTARFARAAFLAAKADRKRHKREDAADDDE